MRKNLLLFAMLLASMAVGTPCALADEIVDITVPTTTFTGNPIFGGGIVTFSTSFEYDNTTATTILASVKIKANDPFGGYFFLDSYFDKYTNQVVFRFEDGTFGLLYVILPSTSTVAILPGVYSTNLFLTNDYLPFNHANASAMVRVTPVPEPTSLLLLIPGLLALVALGLKKATA
jgi:hypothetical protein